MKAVSTLLALCLSLIFPATSQAQTRPSIAEIRLDDGSVVRMTLLLPALEIETKYGKLVVPISDIRRIDFGLHVPAETQLAIDRAIKRLGSSAHKDRSVASADLLGHGHFALPSLHAASKASDQETSTRAAETLRLIEERVSADLLKLRAYDVVHTAEYPIHGKILTPTIKASSAHFGTVDLPLAGILALSLRHAGGHREIVVDAGKWGLSLDAWLDTGIFLHADGRLHVVADGQVDLWPQGPGQYVAAPKGYNTAGKGGQFLAGSLIGRIGEAGKAFFIGERLDVAPREEGRLFLQITPSPWNNVAAGQYRVKIDVR